MTDISTIVTACELVWRQQRLDGSTIKEMRNELESHLLEAQRAGKSPESVVGPSVDQFARSWSDTQPGRPTSFTASITDRETAADRSRTRLYVSIAAVLFVTVLGLMLGPKSTYEDIEVWQWAFVGATFTLLVGEMFSGGFFVLPFGVGAASASALSFAEVEPPALIIVFLVVSALSLWGLREFASKDDDEAYPVGGDRYLYQTGIITKAIQGVGGVGEVRCETEKWPAISDTSQFIPEGSVVRISEVRGIRLVVTNT